MMTLHGGYFTLPLIPPIKGGANIMIRYRAACCGEVHSRDLQSPRLLPEGLHCEYLENKKIPPILDLSVRNNYAFSMSFAI